MVIVRTTKLRFKGAREKRHIFKKKKKKKEFSRKDMMGSSIAQRTVHTTGPEDSVLCET